MLAMAMGGAAGCGLPWISFVGPESADAWWIKNVFQHRCCSFLGIGWLHGEPISAERFWRLACDVPRNRGRWCVVSCCLVLLWSALVVLKRAAVLVRNGKDLLPFD